MLSVTAIPMLSQSQIENVRFCMPSTREMNEIIEFLDKKTMEINSLIAKIIQVIEKLKEYRTTLISAAVTGKIDVRQEAA
jgi:type I restriction enzyme S subunit